MLHYATLVMSFVANRFAELLLPLNSSFSVASLGSALCVAVVFLLVARRSDKRSVKYRVMLRALFPSWLYRNASFKADVALFFINVLPFSAMFGWAMLSGAVVSDTVVDTLTRAFGARPMAGLSGVAGNVIAAIAIFIAYEVAYWLDHYLSHRIPLLWEFHKVHHTAEVLSPLTNFRVHPVDSIVFGNILGLFVGSMQGMLVFMKISTQSDLIVNVIALAFVWIIGHLQHSHLWISFTGPLGHVLLSPAHHQIHHSENPKHFNKNFGSFLSVWDWIAGTLYMPAQRREHLTFGVGERSPQAHTLFGGLVAPFVNAWKQVRAVNKKKPGTPQDVARTSSEFTA